MTAGRTGYWRAWPLAALLLSCRAGPAGAVDFLPAARFEAFGGRYYMEGASPSYGANVFWALTPAVKFTGKDTLIPTVAGQYRRTYEARELVGGSFITHETLDTLAHLKWVRAVGDRYLVKPYGSYKNELIAESADERLGHGLFDHHKYSGGLEIERVGARLRSLRNTFSFYAVRFYNFKSLPTMKFGSEIRAGEDVLDFNAYEYALALDWLPWEQGRLAWSLSGGYHDYFDQKVVSSLGTYLDDVRHDMVWSGDLGLQHRWAGWSLGPVAFEPAGGFHAGFSGVYSNQNHYDPARLAFTEGYYDYHAVVAGPFARLKVWKLDLNLSYDFDRRQYWHRLAQAEDGAYGGGVPVYQNSHTWSYGAAVAVNQYLSVRAQGSYRMGSSNNKFERTYRYNYHTSHFFTGVSIRY